MDTVAYEDRLKSALRGKRTQGDLYILDREGRVLIGNGRVAIDSFLLETLGVSQTERGELSLHLACAAKETVLLCAKRRPVFVFCGLHASAGLLIVYVPHGTACLDTGATLAAMLQDIVVGSVARNARREADPELIATVMSEYALLQAVTGRGMYTQTERIEAISRLTGCGITYDLTPLSYGETDAMLTLQVLTLLAACRSMSVGTRSVLLCTTRDRGKPMLSLEARDKSEDASFAVFEDVAQMARVRGDLFTVTHDPSDRTLVHLVAQLARSELSFQGVKETDRSSKMEAIPMPIALRGKDGELVL